MFQSIQKIKFSITVFVHRLGRMLGDVMHLHTGEDAFVVRGREHKSGIHQDDAQQGFQLQQQQYALFIMRLLQCFLSLFIYTVLVLLVPQLHNTVVYTYHSHCYTQALIHRYQLLLYFTFHTDYTSAVPVVTKLQKYST